MRLVLLLLTATLMLLSASGVWAQNFKNLSAAEVKTIIDQKQTAVIVDTRTVQEFAEGHLPTAINIAPQQFGAMQRFLPQNPNIPLIFYCRGYN